MSAQDDMIQSSAFHSKLWQTLRAEFGKDLQCCVLVTTSLSESQILRQQTFMVYPPEQGK